MHDITVQPTKLRSLPSPEPAAGLDSYHRERALALAGDPRRKANYEAYLGHQRRDAVIDYLPVKLDIENVSRCNFRCTMCVVADWPKGRRSDDMSLGDFRRLIDEQYGLVEIKLQGIGEPLMQGDDFFEMIRYARSKHIWVRTTTNASLLHLRDNYKKLVDSGVNEIQISIDGATRDVFEQIRVGSVFERVVANCKLINDYCREQGVERTKMWTVVQQANCHQLGDLVELGQELGFTNQVFSLEVIGWGLEAWNERNGSVTVEDKLGLDSMLALLEKGRSQGRRVSFWHTTEKYRTDSPGHLCPWPFERAYVSSDLRVVPCCTVGNPDTYQIGAALDNNGSFSDVWKSDEFADFRRAHLEGRPPQICRACYEQPKE
ncbi:radical SAM/SPASM domain-containing protein [Bradyrhizobium sp.]|uniref:radical SAM protein n=1 Tax=Bradyrhizobium sp. TaxID=376 RepID=UPI003C4D68E4